MTTPIIAPLPGPFTAQPVTAGLAESLARCAYFRLLDHPQADELDVVARYLIGNVGDPEASRDLWRQLQPTCEHLWHLITDDWTERDLDELTDAQWEALVLPTHETELDTRRENTIARLAGEIEGAILAHRIGAARAKRIRAYGEAS